MSAPATDPASPSTVVSASSPKFTNMREPGRMDLINPPSTRFNPDPATAIRSPIIDCGPIFPYSSLRDGAVGIEGLARAFYTVRRRAWNLGWKPPGGDTDQTFMASQLLVLSNTGCFDKSAPPLDTVDMDMEGQAAVLPPGKSSFSFYSEATAVDRTAAAPRPNNFELLRTMIGCQLLCLVNIDPTTRKPKPLPVERVTEMNDAAAKTCALGRVKSLGLTPLGRLPTHEEVVSESKSFTYTQSLRCLDDRDFNLHINQSVYFRCALNAIVSMTAHWQLDAAEQQLPEQHKQLAYINSIARAVRIDYVSEITAAEGEMICVLSMSDKISSMGTGAIGPEMLRKIVPPSSSRRTTQRVCYFAITLKGDGDEKKIYSRGFVAFDYTPVPEPNPSFE